jgi:hypothetical protein
VAHPPPPWSHAEDVLPRLVEAAVTQLPRPELLLPPLRPAREPDPGAIGLRRDEPSPELAEEPKPRSFGCVDLARLLFTEPSVPAALPTL